MLICHTYIFFGEVSVHSNFWLLIVSIYQTTFLSNTIKVSGKKSMKQIPKHWILYNEGSWCLEDKKQLQSLSQVNFLEKVSIVLWIVVVGGVKEMKLRIWRIKDNSLQYRALERREIQKVSEIWRECPSRIQQNANKYTHVTKLQQMGGGECLKTL